jgi:hypothetical protein
MSPGVTALTVRQMLSGLCHSSTLILAIRWSSVSPAFVTRMSSRPDSAITSFITRTQSSGSPTSL